MTAPVEQSARSGRPGATTVGNGNQTFNDTVGTLMLGVLSLLLFIALQRSHARNRALMNQIQQLTRRYTPPTSRL